MPSISIIGAGWLGMPLAVYLSKCGHDLILSTQDLAKVEQLRAKHWKVEQYQLGARLPDTLGKNEITIINIPPGKRNLDPDEHLIKIQRLCSDLLQMGTKNLIFVSTTSVYGNASGTVTELTECRPITNSGIAHLKIEQFVHKLMPQQVTVLRLAGLIGCLLYTSPSPRDLSTSRMPSSA